MFNSSMLNQMLDWSWLNYANSDFSKTVILRLARFGSSRFESKPGKNVKNQVIWPKENNIQGMGLRR